MYQLLLADVADAIDNLEAAGHTVKVAGMMWMQGESDTLHEWMANAYESNLTAFIARVRSDLATPDMPFILGRIHDKLMAQAPYVELVRTAQVNVAQGDSWADWIDTDTFPLQLDLIHYNSSGTIELGQAFAEAYLEMTGFKINPGLNDHWYNPATTGQGLYITVFPDMGKVTLTMFTYDTLLPPVEATANLGDPSQRWLNALGNYSGNQAVLNVSFDSDGIFDSSEKTTKVRGYGTIILTFDNCNSGTLEYDIPSLGLVGIIPIQRVVGDNIPLCEAFISTD